MAASAERAAFVQQEFRSSTWSSEQVKEWYGKVARDTKDNPFVSYFSNLTDADKYLLERGQLLGRHARRFRTTVDQLLSEADIDFSTVIPGMTLVDTDLAVNMIVSTIAIESLDLEDERTVLNFWAIVGEAPAYEETASGGTDTGESGVDGGHGTATGAGSSVVHLEMGGFADGESLAAGVGARVIAGAGAAAGAGAGAARGVLGGGAELREDGSFALREDGTKELRE
jgi:hypothetical protein